MGCINGLYGATEAGLLKNGDVENIHVGYVMVVPIIIDIVTY